MSHSQINKYFVIGVVIMWNQEPWLLVEYKSPVQNVIAYARIACLLLYMSLEAVYAIDHKIQSCYKGYPLTAKFPLGKGSQTHCAFYFFLKNLFNTIHGYFKTPLITTH